MGADIRNSDLYGAMAAGLAAAVLLLCGATAYAEDECPALPSVICSAGDQPGNASCFQAGATFVQQGGKWLFALRNSVPYASKMHFIYVVDGNRTRKPYGLVFVGVMRDPSISTDATNVRLSQNKEFNVHKVERLQAYNNAVTWQEKVTVALNDWATLKDTDPVFTLDNKPKLAEFNFKPPEQQTDLHARLYRFQSANKLICIPFNVGVPSSIDAIYGWAVDIFGNVASPAPSASGVPTAGEMDQPAAASKVVEFTIKIQ